KAADEKGDKPALKVESPLPPQAENGTAPPALPEEQWKAWTYRQYYDDARKAGKGLMQLGFQPFDTLAIWGFNAPEWMLSALAAGFAGGKVGGLYPTDTPETAAFKIAHSGASVVVLEDKAKLDRLIPALAKRDEATSRIKAFVAYGFEPEANLTVEVKGSAKPVLGWSQFMQLYKDVDDSTIDARTQAVKPGHCAVLVYTSGTTGEPKAVMLSHDNMVYETRTVMNMARAHMGLCAKAEQERVLSYLPLSHVAGKMIDVCFPFVATSTTPAWVTIYFARPYDLKAGSLGERLKVARPTVFLGVPLVWEKIADKLRAIGAANSGLKKKIAAWAKGKGLAHSKACLLGGDGTKPFAYGLADKLALSKVKAKLGLDCLKFGATGAAPIRVDTLQYFGSLGININEVYGMSESCAACTVSTDRAHFWGSCGFQLPGVEVKAFKVDPSDNNKKEEVPRAPGMDVIDEAYQGELCFRGRSIMMGYLGQPDLGAEHVRQIEKKTGETIDAEGWLHSGDKGMVTKHGMVKITGRYKEIIIGAGGENIAPVPIEDHIKGHCDGINEVMIIGDKRKYNVAIVTLKAVGAQGETPGTDQLDAGAKRVNPNVSKISEAMGDSVWIEAVTAAIKSANNNGTVCPNNAFKIQKFMILPTNFSEEQGFLTPTKKLKRAVVESAFSKQIEMMYNSSEMYVRYAE
ncbi:ACSBG2, partial [Symbiodinium pilosum]